MSSKKIGRGRPAVDSERVDTRLPRDILDCLDRFTEAEKLKNRPEAVRLALREYFTHLGYLELPPDRENAN